MSDYDDIDFENLANDLEEFSGNPYVKQALTRGVDLKKYSQELEKELKVAEMECVNQYVNNSEHVSELHAQIQECDAVLARMQNMLLGFQGDLSGISGEIKHLQNESLSMSLRLKNKRAIEERLSSFVDKAIISSDVVENILAPQVNEHFLTAVKQLNAKLSYLNKSTIPTDGSSFNLLPQDTAAGTQMLPDMISLKARSITKARDFFVMQITSLRNNKTNVQVIQQNSLLKYSTLYHFLQTDAPVVALDIRSQYEDTMGRIVHNVFKNYYTQLCKLDLVIASKGDLLVLEESSMKSVFTQRITFNRDKTTTASDTFALGDRAMLLDNIESEPILLHVALAEGKKYTHDAIMRSVLKHLVDAATSEFLFILQFFDGDNSNDISSNSSSSSSNSYNNKTYEIFDAIFGKSLSTLLESTENYLLSCYDAVGLLLLSIVQRAIHLIMQRRRIPVLDTFFERLELMILPRLTVVLGMNITSLQQTNANNNRSYRLQVGGGVGVVGLAPHYVSKRYADLASSIAILSMIDNNNGNSSNNSSNSSSTISNNNNSLPTMMQSLRTELIALLQRLAMKHFVTSKDQHVFYINNYDRILSTLEIAGVENIDSSAFDNLLLSHREHFAEEEIKSAFPRLVSFVQQTEQMLNTMLSADVEDGKGEGEGGAAASAGKLQLDEGIVESLVGEFSNTWRGGVQQINDDVLAYFANFRNGMEILKQVLTQLLLYYTRFQDIIKKAWAAPGKVPSFTRDIVSTATIMMEIKKYNRML